MKDLNQLKRKACKIGIIFIGLMFLLTMISKTIYTLLLPCVEIDKVKSGAIETDIYASGKIGYDKLMIDKRKILVRSSKDGQVTKCYIKENDKVKKGDPLIEIQGQADEEKNLEYVQGKKEIDINMSACEREKGNIAIKYKNKQEELSSKQKELHDFSDDYEIIDIEQQINQKSQEVKSNDELYEAGAIAKNVKDKSEDDLKLLNDKLKLLKEEHDTKLQNDIKEIQEEMLELENNLLQQDEKIEMEKNKLLEIDKKQEKKTLYSQVDGVVYEVKIGVGAAALQGDELIIIIPEDIPITLTFRLNEELADKIDIGDKISWSKDQRDKNAEVVKKTYDSDKEDMIVTCNIDKELVSDFITDYQTYRSTNISIKHKSEIYKCIVPTSALSLEGEKAYIYAVEEKDTVFEKKYIVHKQSVVVIQEGDEVSAVEGIQLDTPIVIQTNKTLSDNSEVGAT